MRGLSIAAVILAFVLPAAAPVTASTAPRPASQPRFSAEEIQKLDQIVQQKMAEQRVPGVNLDVFVPGRGSLVRSYGSANLATGAPMSARDHVRIASITKTFTGIAVLQLVDEGRLSLRDKLSEFVKGVPNGKRITIRQLLGMTGGIYDFTQDEQFNALFSSNPNMRFKPRDVIPILQRHGPDFPPGERVNYSDSNYVLLAIVIKEVTRQSPRRVIQHRILDRLNLTGTSFPVKHGMPSPFAIGYYGGDDGLGTLRDYTRLNPAVPTTGGAMISTLRDLRTWARALGTGRLLSKQTFSKQREFRPLELPGPLRFGYGLGIFKLNGFIGHNGAIYGYNTSMFFLPSARATIVIEANKSTNFSDETLSMFVPIATQLFPAQFPAPAGA